MERISRNFSLQEFANSTVARQRGIVNEIPEGVKPAIRALVINLLQPLCDRTGWHDRINSGYRCTALNEAVGGVPTSQHLRGEAADNVFYAVKPGGETYNIPPVDVLREVVHSGLPFDQAIAYPTFVHLSYSAAGRNRGMVLYSANYKGERL